MRAKTFFFLFILILFCWNNETNARLWRNTEFSDFTDCENIIFVQNNTIRYYLNGDVPYPTNPEGKIYGDLPDFQKDITSEVSEYRNLYGEKISEKIRIVGFIGSIHSENSDIYMVGLRGKDSQNKFHRAFNIGEEFPQITFDKDAPKENLFKFLYDLSFRQKDEDMRCKLLLFLSGADKTFFEQIRNEDINDLNIDKMPLNLALAYVNLFMRVDGLSCPINNLSDSQIEALATQCTTDEMCAKILNGFCSWIQLNAKSKDKTSLLNFSEKLSQKYKAKITYGLTPYFSINDINYLVSEMKETSNNADFAYAFWKALMYLVNDKKGIVGSDDFRKNKEKYIAKVISLIKKYKADLLKAKKRSEEIIPFTNKKQTL